MYAKQMWHRLIFQLDSMKSIWKGNVLRVKTNRFNLIFKKKGI